MSWVVHCCSNLSTKVTADLATVFEEANKIVTAWAPRRKIADTSTGIVHVPLYEFSKESLQPFGSGKFGAVYSFLTKESSKAAAKIASRTPVDGVDPYQVLLNEIICAPSQR